MTAFLKNIYTSSTVVRKELDVYLASEKAIYLPDSTKFSQVRQYKKTEYTTEEKRINESGGFTILAEYFPRRGVLAVDDVKVDQTPDVKDSF